MADDKRRWKIKQHGDGIPLSVFDVPDEEESVPPPTRNDGPNRVSPLVQNGIAVVVTLVWAISFVADVLSADYAPPAGIHVAFTTIVGSIFGYQLISGRGDK